MAGFGELAGEVEEDGACFVESGWVFEGVGDVAAAADAFEACGGGEVEEEDGVGARGEGFVIGDEGGWVSAACALIGCGAPVVAVDDDDPASVEGRLDGAADVHGAVEAEEAEFFVEGEAAGLGGAAEFGAPFEAGGFFGEGAGDGAFAAVLGEEGGGGGFACAVDAFDGEEEATWDEGFHGERGEERNG